MDLVDRLRALPRFGDGSSLPRVGAALTGVRLPAGIKVTGSNGKGSTCAMAEAIVRAHGLRTGLFTSPHLLRVEERVRLDGEPVASHRLARALDRACATLRGRYGAFEALTVAAAMVFEEDGVQAAVWEAGIGGRLDPTRLVPGPVGVITSVSLEHTALLGADVASIAADKAGIVEAGDRLVLGPLPPAARAAAARSDVTIIDAREAILPPVGLPGPHQRDNARCAVAASRALLEHRWQPNAAIRALAEARCPGRLEHIGGAWVDAAHNADGLTRVAAAMQHLVGDRPLVLVFGASYDRPWAEMLAAIEPRATELLVTAARHKGASPERIVGCARGRARAYGSVEAALPVALARAEALGGVVLVTGGLFLAAEATAWLAGEDPAGLQFF